MSLAIGAIITGLAVGSVYGLIALGYTVVFNATRVFNLAQGDLVMVAVMLSYFALSVQHWSQPVGAIFVIAGVMAVSLFEERFVVRPFLKRSSDNIGWFISTLAFSLILESVVTIIYGNHPPEPIPSPLSSHAVHFGSVVISPQLLLAIGTLLVATLLIELFYKRTWIGQAIRATAEDREVAALRGIAPTQMSILGFGIGGLVAAVAGIVIGPVVFSNVSIGLEYGIYGFIALAIGGFGSLRGAVLGAWALGVTQQLFDLYSNPQYESVAALGLLILVLLVRPTGLFGGKTARVV